MVWIECLLCFRVLVAAALDGGPQGPSFVDFLAAERRLQSKAYVEL